MGVGWGAWDRGEMRGALMRPGPHGGARGFISRGGGGVNRASQNGGGLGKGLN